MSYTLMLVDWQTLNDAKESLSKRAQLEVEMLQAQATAYVWGRQDAGEDPNDTGYSIDFGRTYAMHSCWHESGQLCYRRNIQDAFLRFRAGLSIED